MTEEIVRALQSIVRGHAQLDTAAHGPDLRPVLPRGPRDAAICFMGRDPGEKEAKAGRAFIGESGRLLRNGLLEFYAPSVAPDEQARLAIGERFFWMSTVPFKPVGNKPWSRQVRLACQPLLLQLLHEQWSGRDVVTFGNEAFSWFEIDQPSEVRQQLRAFWEQGDTRYERSIEVPLPGLARTVCLHPMPHPSPANAVWRTRFPALLRQRLGALREA